MIQFECSNCSQRIKTKEEHAGKVCKCPKCQTSLKIPIEEVPADLPEFSSGQFGQSAGENQNFVQTPPPIPQEQTPPPVPQQQTNQIPSVSQTGHISHTPPQEPQQPSHQIPTISESGPVDQVPEQTAATEYPETQREPAEQPFGYQPEYQPAYQPVAGVQYAGFWKRFAAVFIDGIILGVIGGVIGGIIGIIVNVSMSGMGSSQDAVIFTTQVASGLFSFIMRTLYFTLMESSSKQATLGKMALGIKVTDLQGNRLSFTHALGRYFAKFVSTFTLLIGYMMAGWTEKKQALHDMIASTLVVNKN